MSASVFPIHTVTSLPSSTFASIVAISLAAPVALPPAVPRQDELLLVEPRLGGQPPVEEQMAIPSHRQPVQ